MEPGYLQFDLKKKEREKKKSSYFLFRSLLGLRSISELPCLLNFIAEGSIDLLICLFFFPLFLMTVIPAASAALTRGCSPTMKEDKVQKSSFSPLFGKSLHFKVVLITSCSLSR